MSIQNFINEMEHIPTVSSIALKVLQKLANPEITINEIAHLIEQDQALTANILKVANSGYFEFMDEVKTIKKAVVLIGFKLTREITSAFAVKSLFDSLKPVKDIDYIQIWKHALYTALLAQKLSKIYHYNEDELFISGLLHDIGIIIQLFYDAENYSYYYITSREQCIPYYEAEKGKNANMNHAELGFQVLRNWSIPHNIIIPIRWHHQFFAIPPELDEFQKPTQLIALANNFSFLYFLNEDKKELYFANNSEYLKLTEIFPEFENLYQELSQEISKEEQFLNLFY